MAQTEILIRIILTIIFGAILGLESETREIANKGKIKAIKDEKSRLGGLRTYSVLSLFGGIAGLFYIKEIEILSYIMFTSVMVLIISAYIMNVQLKQALD
ncbi:MAG: hypothetical protein Q9M91_05415 [Candidatus Dojkabacteria bacterium]|nr:hypothetical protein [Candidatus Dojkabacteria bacterium]